MTKHTAYSKSCQNFAAGTSTPADAPRPAMMLTGTTQGVLCGGGRASARSITSRHFSITETRVTEMRKTGELWEGRPCGLQLGQAAVRVVSQ